VSVPDITPTLLAAGPGKPLLILGAGLGTSVMGLWSPAIPFLTDFEVVGVDLPGHGASPASADAFSVGDLAAAVAGVATKLAAGRNTFYAGVSLAGAVALQLGLEHPGCFGAVAAICSAPSFGEPQQWRDRAEVVSQQGTPTQITGSAQRWFGPGFLGKNPEVSARLLHNLQDADRFSYAHCCLALAGFNVTDRLKGLNIPLLAIAGAEDTVCPPEVSRAMAASAPNGRAAVVPGVAHQAPAEAPVAVAALLTEFFQQFPK